MGGLMIMFSVGISSLLWVDLSNLYYWIVIAVFISFGMIGFVDDYIKLTGRTHMGLPGKLRLFLEAAISGAAVFASMKLMSPDLSGQLAFPFFKDMLMNLGWFFVPFGLLVIVGAANAVNLTDGLDGLAIGPIMITAGCFGVISYLIGNSVFSDYLQIHHVPGSGELAIFCGALIGAGLGFLWYNAPPAEVFMGDTGSLSMGGALGIIAVITKHEIVLAIIGGVL